MRGNHFLAKMLFAIFLGIGLSSGASAQTRANDPTFNPTNLRYRFGDGASGNVTPSVLQSDGKIIIWGAFTTYNGTAIIRVARPNTNGTLDATCNIKAGVNSYNYLINMQS